MDTQDTILEEMRKRGLIEPGIDCSDAENLAKTVAGVAEGSDLNVATATMRLGVILKYASAKMETSEPAGPEDAPKMGMREAIASSVEKAEQHHELLGARADQFVEEVANVVTARLGEMPMPGLQGQVTLGVGLAIKWAGKEMLLEKENAPSR